MEVKKGVIEKLVVFTVAIAIIPLSILYASLHGYLDCEYILLRDRSTAFAV